MNGLVFWVQAIAIFTVCAVIGNYAGPYFGISPKTGFLAAMLVAFGILSILVGIKRKILIDVIKDLPSDQRDMFESTYADIKYNTRSGKITTWVGFIWVNGPIIPLLVLPLFLYQYLNQSISTPPLMGFILLLFGFLFGWVWWSVNVSLWRVWALARGIHPEEVQWRGEDANILWKKGTFLEKTELANILHRLKK
jgi:hypothetical protein